MEYNCRMLDYAVGSHVTFYKKTISKEKEINENFRKTYSREDRTEEAEKHCLKVSLANTKNKIYQIARSNPWDWFITLTFNRTKTDASEYDLIVKRLHVFLSNTKARKCPDLKYLIVPELHSDKKNYHFHGLLSGCDGLHFNYSGHKDKKKNPIFNIEDWSYGFTTATRVQDTNRVSWYITKYITKTEMQYLKNKKRYYASQNINIVQPDFFIMDEEDFRIIYADRIVYCKSVDVKESGQHITYYELKD